VVKEVHHAVKAGRDAVKPFHGVEKGLDGARK
jgi:hypothetical protein